MLERSSVRPDPLSDEDSERPTLQFDLVTSAPASSPRYATRAQRPRAWATPPLRAIPTQRGVSQGARHSDVIRRRPWRPSPSARAIHGRWSRQLVPDAGRFFSRAITNARGRGDRRLPRRSSRDRSKGRAVALRAHARARIRRLPSSVVAVPRAKAAVEKCTRAGASSRRTTDHACARIATRRRHRRICGARRPRVDVRLAKSIVIGDTFALEASWATRERAHCRVVRGGMLVSVAGERTDVPDDVIC